jgi:hypothetical protein
MRLLDASRTKRNDHGNTTTLEVLARAIAYLHFATLILFCLANEVHLNHPRSFGLIIRARSSMDRAVR